MGSIILFSLATIGMTHILVDGQVFSGVRDRIAKNNITWLSSLVECYQCSGFWCGVLVGGIVFGVSTISFLSVLSLLVYGCAGSFLSMWAAGHLGYLDSLTNIDLDELE